MEEYLVLRDKVDAQFEKLFSKHRTHMNCELGCHQCCVPDLTVTRLEADMIRSYLKAYPERVERLKEIQKQRPHRGQRCEMLNADGQCVIYEARPLVCRSHGVPLLVQIDEKREGLDACPLNFSEGMSMLDVGDWIHLETLHTMLALIDWRYALDEDRPRPDPEIDRVKLTLEDLMQEIS